MKLGILKTDTVRPEWVPQHGEYPDMFIALLSPVDPELSFTIYDVEHGHYPSSIDEVDAYLMTGSAASVYEDLPWIPPLMAFVRTLYDARKKLIGICFGHQLMAYALGGKVERSPKGWGVGVHQHCFAHMPTWHDQGKPELNILVSHQDQVVVPAANSQVLAGSEFCPNAVCQIGAHFLSLQGHPEFLPAYALELLHSRVERIDEQTTEAALKTFATEAEGERVARWMVNFLREA